MGKISDTSFFVVQGWMINKLHLKGNQLQVFAIIHGFSHSENNEFSGSLQYLCEFTGSSRSTVIRSLSELQKQGFIEKREIYENGVKFNRYKSLIDSIFHFDTPSVKMTPPPCQNDTTPRVKMTPNNIEEYNRDNIANTRSASAALDDRFECFWKAYPVKKAKQQALKTWRKIKPNEELTQVIIDAVERQKKWEDWKKDGGRYIPYPSTWLNQGRWEDEQQVTSAEEELVDGYWPR